MKIKSALVTQISGSVGGFTGSHNRGGLYLRARTIPTDPSSTAQQNQRANLAARSQEWRVLTQAQRDAWNAYATTVAMQDTLGDPIVPTGFEMYVTGNTLKIQAGGSVVSAGPGGTGLTPLGAISLSNISGGSNNFDIGFDNTVDWATAAGGHLLVFAGQGRSPGIAYYRSPFRFADVVDGAATPPTSPATVVNPFTFNVGERLFVRVRAVDAQGRSSAEMILSGIAGL